MIVFFQQTSTPSTAHPTYKHVVLTAVIDPMHCRSDAHVKNSILVHPTYFKLSLGHDVNRYECFEGTSDMHATL